MVKQRRKRKFNNTIEHKHCGSCKKWKPLDKFAKRGNGKDSNCKACKKEKEKQRRKERLEKLQKAREAGPSGFLVCLKPSCKKGLQPVDQFIGAYVRNNEPTSCCLTCRNKQKEEQKRRQAPCQNVWDDWRIIHPCVMCMNDPNHVHNPLLIEADHLPEFKKLKKCSAMNYWSHSKRGPAALRAELMKCEALCKFHHRLQTQQRDHNNGRVETRKSKIRKRAIINAEKYRRGCCFLCKRVLKEGEECGFDFDHRDPKTKFMYNGKTKGPSKFVLLQNALFDIQWPLEQAKCDLLCANCDKLKTFECKDGYRK